jgi:hypothetical protein
LGIAFTFGNIFHSEVVKKYYFVSSMKNNQLLYACVNENEGKHLRSHAIPKKYKAFFFYIKMFWDSSG